MLHGANISGESVVKVGFQHPVLCLVPREQKQGALLQLRRDHRDRAVHSAKSQLGFWRGVQHRRPPWPPMGSKGASS